MPTLSNLAEHSFVPLGVLVTFIGLFILLALFIVLTHLEVLLYLLCGQTAFPNLSQT